MADVSELRMELIFPRSTLARLTPSGVVGALVAVADVGVSGVTVAAAEVLVLEAFVGVMGGFDGTSDFIVFEAATAGLSFLSSTRENNN